MKIQDGFTIDAPAADVWALLSDPERVATLLPGAEDGGPDRRQHLLGRDVP